MNNLKAARKAAGMTQAEVARIVGITQNGYSYWENGKTKIDNESALRLADIFSVSVDYLLGREEESSRSAIRIPVYGSVPAGIPMEAIEDIVDWEELPAAMAAGGKEYFALLVKGDSMYPDYLDGDTVIVRKQPTCISGDVCVVYVNGYDATLKTVKLNEAEGELTLVPKNPNYPPRTYSRQETADLPVSIAGVVVELRRKIK